MSEQLIRQKPPPSSRSRCSPAPPIRAFPLPPSPSLVPPSLLTMDGAVFIPRMRNTADSSLTSSSPPPSRTLLVFLSLSSSSPSLRRLLVPPFVHISLTEFVHVALKVCAAGCVIAPPPWSKIPLPATLDQNLGRHLYVVFAFRPPQKLSNFPALCISKWRRKRSCLHFLGGLLQG